MKDFTSDPKWHRTRDYFGMNQETPAQCMAQFSREAANEGKPIGTSFCIKPEGHEGPHQLFHESYEKEPFTWYTVPALDKPDDVLRWLET